MTSNHIGQSFQFIKNIADECGWNYSHGTLTERPFKNAVIFPLVHCNIGNVSVSDSTATIQMNVAIMDRVSFLKTEDRGLNEETLYDKIGYTENQNYAHILQELYVKFLVGLYRQKITNYNEIQIVNPISFTPFIETDESVVAGHQVTLNMTIFNPFVTDGRCELP